MPLVIWERADSREVTVSPQGTATLRYGVMETEDETLVSALVEASISTYYYGLIFQSYKLKTEGGGIWDVEVQYGKRAPLEAGDLNSFGWSFDTTGGQQKITQSKETIDSVAATGTAPDYQGAIGVSGDSVEGCEITVPALQLSLTYRIPSAQMTFGYLQLLYQLTGTTNAFPWKGFAAGELLFLGASGQQRGVDDPDLTFKFSGAANKIDIEIGDIVVPFKRGWEYVWIRYDDAVDGTAKKLVQRPSAVYVERVYDEVDFSLLGIGN